MKSSSSIGGRRASGVLLHPTSLPGPGIGDLGEPAYRFVDWLDRAGQSFWQILPLVPVDSGGSPYNGLSAMAGNPLLVAPSALLDEGLLKEADLASGSTLPRGWVDYPAVLQWKNGLLTAAFERWSERATANGADELERFKQRNRDWLPDYTLFRALRDRFDQQCWTDWPAELRDREASALEEASRELRQEIERYAFQQFLFDRQWRSLRKYANEHGVRIIGDLPIFVAHDSADVWANRDIFQLEPDGTPAVVAGVPPDYFSETGQRWGNPLYRWGLMKERGYRWWVERFRRTFEMVDLVRVDHFRGFESYWEIPAASETAVEGRWVRGPGAEFFRAVEAQLGELPVIAEDLGLITQEVEELRDELELPGMRVLQFAFDGDPKNPHLPQNHPKRSIGYTGTHDNDTVMGWWRSIPSEERVRVIDSLAVDEPTHWDFIEAVLESDAALAVTPLQDVLGLGTDARMNTPGVPSRNWTWRTHELPPAHAAERLRELSQRTGRA